MIEIDEMFRVCNKCGVRKPISEFNYFNSGKYCKRCRDCNYSDYAMKNGNKGYYNLIRKNRNYTECLPKWVLRNLKNFGNCCIGKTLYEKYSKEIDEIAYIRNEVGDNCYAIVKKKECDLNDNVDR